MKKENKALDVIINYVLEAIDRKFKKLICDKEALVISTDGNVCTVIIDGSKYSVKNGIGITFVNGDKCLVHYINANEQNKIIIAKL